LKRVCLFDSWGWQKRPLSLAVSGHEPDFMTNMTSLAIRAALPVALLVVPPVAVHGVALQPQNVTTVIEGRVIRQGTSEPIPDTQMTLLRSGGFTDDVPEGRLVCKWSPAATDLE